MGELTNVASLFGRYLGVLFTAVCRIVTFFGTYGDSLAITEGKMYNRV